MNISDINNGKSDGDGSIIYNADVYIKSGFIPNCGSLFKADIDKVYAKIKWLGIKGGKGGIYDTKDGGSSLNTGFNSAYFLTDCIHYHCRKINTRGKSRPLHKLTPIVMTRVTKLMVILMQGTNFVGNYLLNKTIRLRT